MTFSFDLATLPVLHTCQAAVVGGGFAGVSAAVALARRGFAVMLIEPRTYLGREVTATLRPWLQLDEEALAGAPEVIRCVVERAGRRQTAREIALNLDALKLALEDYLLEAGVRLLYASVVTGLHAPGGELAGLVIGNKSGRQLIECRLVIDATETASVARLAGEPFEPPEAEAVYRRTLEFDGVAPLDPVRFPFDQPVVLHGQTVILHRGYRDSRHVLVECLLRLPQRHDSAFAASARELAARRLTMDFAAALTAEDAFSAAYLSGASYELCGPHTTRLAGYGGRWLSGEIERASLDLPGVTAPLPACAGRLRGTWYLGDAIRWPGLHADAFWDPSLASAAGHLLGSLLADHWHSASASSAAAASVVAPLRAQTSAGLRVREPESPQRGRAFRRVAVESGSVPVAREVDVLVVGGGSSGATAAITAAREGLKTVLVEMNPGLGGTGTFGGVHSYWFGRRTGFAGEVMRLVNEMHEYLHHPAATGVIPKWNIEAKAYALARAAHEAGVEMLFNAFMIGVLVDGNRVGGVVVATRQGPVALRARVVIDASGDGDVAAFAGAKFLYGNERDHATMWYALAQFTRPGLTRNHFTSTVDVSNIEDYTRAILAGRRRGGKGDMHDHGIYVAPRESRHILGDVVLTLTDQLLQRRWPDVVNIAFSNHDVKGHSGSDWIRAGLIPPNLEVEIPYRILLPGGLDNLLVVGKAISATHDALPAIRMQADLENLGGVAALAASLACRNNQTPREIDVRALQERLVEAGVLPEAILQRQLVLRRYDEQTLRRFIDDLGQVYPFYHYADMELTDVFEGDIPLVELCCAGPQVIPLLEEALAQATSRAQRLALAQALALAGSTSGVPVLVEALERELSGPELPPRTGDIRHSQLPPDQGAMPDPAYLLYSLGMAPDERAVPVWRRVASLLASAREEDFYDGLKGTFYYVDALCFGVERLATADLIPLLQQVHGYAPFHGQSRRQGFEPDYVQERLAYLEVTLGRALARCGSPDGYVVLISYLEDARALLAEYAHSELVSITGEDRGKDTRAWSDWLESNGDRLAPVPWRGPTEPMAVWGQSILRAGPRT